MEPRNYVIQTGIFRMTYQSLNNLTFSMSKGRHFLNLSLSNHIPLQFDPRLCALEIDHWTISQLLSTTKISRQRDCESHREKENHTYIFCIHFSNASVNYITRNIIRYGEKRGEKRKILQLWGNRFFVRRLLLLLGKLVTRCIADKRKFKNKLIDNF